MVANGDVDKQIWLMEFGWTTEKRNPDYSWYATDEKTQGDLIVSAFKFARSNWSPWIGVMTLWTIADPWWDPAKEQHPGRSRNQTAVTDPLTIGFLKPGSRASLEWSSAWREPLERFEPGPRGARIGLYRPFRGSRC